ncbi:MAG: hypothetical protein IAG13_17555, partial [Deltaproteobacteria bacterium]|nr:hypothetical protein [Nannocystaceae bacterium]
MGEPTDPARARSHRHGWWLLALVVACGASFPFLSRMMNANERPRLLQAVALVDHGTWALDPVIAGGIDPGVDVARAPAEHGGGLYPNKPPGATVPAVLAYAIQRVWCAASGGVPSLAGLTLLARLFGALLPIVVLAELAR